MFKRILTFALAGILVLETPSAAYAAGKGVGAATSDATERVSVIDDTENDSVTENSNAEKDSTENQHTENDKPGDGGTAGDGAENDNPENGGTIDDSTGSENSGENGAENGDNENNDTESDDTGDSDTETEGSETDNGGNNGTGSDNNENSGTDDNDSVSENDVSVSENDLSVLENTLFAASGDDAAALAEEAVTAISYEEAKANGVTIHAPAGQEHAAWYSFTAPRAGRYAFFTDEAGSEIKSTIYVNLCTATDTKTKNHQTRFSPAISSTTYHYLWISTNYMEQGETVYLETYASGSEDRTFTMKAADQQESEAGEDGSKSLVLANGDRITFKAQAGCERLRLEAELECADSGMKYYICPFWCPADHSTGDLSSNLIWYDSDRIIRLDKSDGLQGQVVTGKLTQKTAYDVSYVLLSCPKDMDYCSMKFEALIPGVQCVTKDCEGENALYIYGYTCEAHAIMIDVEPIGANGTGNQTLYCYYAPADESEEEKAVRIDEWKQYAFTGLRSGTEYQFVFRTNTWSKPIKTVTYRTTGQPLDIIVSDYTAVIEEDFTKLSIAAKTNYAGDDKVYFCCNFKDEINSYQWKKEAFRKKGEDGQDYQLSYENYVLTEMVFLPDQTYEMEIWTEIPGEGIKTKPQRITMHMPAEAVCGEEDVVLTVTRDNEAPTTVKCEFQILKKPADWIGSMEICVYYKPLGAAGYAAARTLVNAEKVEDGEGWIYKGTSSIADLQAGVEYEFLLYAGGILRRCTLDLNESGTRLERVEDIASDYVGPYDFTQTYRLTDTKEELSGDYYVQLQTRRLDGTYVSNQYVNDGAVISLKEAEAYQMTYSSAAQMSRWRWLVPNGKYNLRWLVGREENVTEDNAVCCLYENLAMASASPLKIEETGFMAYRVALDEKDVAALKTNGIQRDFSCYIRKKGASTYVKYPGSFTYSASNNYSRELRSLDLSYNSSYELYLEYDGARYAEGVLDVGGEQQTLRVDAVEATASVVRIHYTIQNADPAKVPIVHLYVRKAGDYAWMHRSSRGNAGKVMLDKLQSDTTYEYRIGISAHSDTPVDELKSCQEGRFTTKPDTKTLSVISVKPGMERVKINCMLSGLKEAGEEDIYKHLACFYRPVMEGTEQSDWKNVGVTIGGRTMVECRLTGLTKETTYEYRVGYAQSSILNVGGLVCPVEGTFTTTPDLRRTQVTVTPGMHRTQFDCVYNNLEDSAYLHLYIREDTAEAGWQKMDVRQASESGNGSVQTCMVEGLKDHTDYQYMVGLGKQADTEPDTLVGVSRGTFTTLEDTRGLQATVQAKVISVNIVYTLTGMEYADEGYLCGFLRKQSAGEAAEGSENGSSWKKQFAEPVGSKSTGGRLRIKDLEVDTAYELLIGFGVGQDSEVDGLVHTQTVTFRTLEDQRKLSDAEAEVKKAGVILRTQFSGNMELQSSYVSFFYRIKGEKKFQRAEYITNTSTVESSICAVTLTGLKRGTAYEYTAVLSDTRSGAEDPDSVLREDWKVSGEFATPSAEVPESIQLLQKELYLNVNEGYLTQKGFGYEDLKLTWKPEHSTKDFLWESSDAQVAVVSKDGRVTAAAPGTAQITASSAYDSEVADTCRVVVGNYQIGREDGEGTVSLMNGTTFTAVKGQRYGGYGLYDLSSGAPVAVSDVEVASDNAAVVSWNAGELLTGQTGTAHLVFEAPDGVRAVMSIDVETVPGRGFDIVGFQTSASKYPAVKEAEMDGERVQYTLACRDGLTYTAIGEIMPQSVAFDSSDFTWRIDNTYVAQVDDEGVITPKTAGKAVLYVTPKNMGGEGGAPYLQQTCEVTLLVKELPSEQLADATPVYALANISKKIGDIHMPKEEAWEDWRWEEPNTPLVINGVNRTSYPFRAVYTGEAYYPEEKTINVYIARVTGMFVVEEADPGHNKVIEVAETDEEGNPVQSADRLVLNVAAKGYGKINSAEETNYFYDMDIMAPAGVIVEKGAFDEENGLPGRDVTIAAVKPGSYTITAAIKVKDRNNKEKTLAKATYKIKAVESKQAYVTLEPEQTENIALEDGRIVIDSAADTKIFKVQAKLTDLKGQDQEAFDSVKLAWSTTDKKVIAVKPSADTHSAQITVKGEGHAILKAKVKDAAGHAGTLQVEIQNNAPRVSTDKAVVNLAYDYDTSAGRELAGASLGMVEVVPVYGKPIRKVLLYNEDQETVCSDLLLINGATSGWRLILRDNKNTKTGVYYCCLCVSTDMRDYFYPLQVTVKDEQAKVTVKSNRAANLFYRSEPASVDISIPKSTAQIGSVTWEADAADPDHGFGVSPVEYAQYDKFGKAGNAERFYFKQGDIQLDSKNKPENPDILSGAVKVWLNGYKEPNEGVAVSLKWSYKKPVIVTKQPSVALIPTMADKNTGRFDLYNKTEQQTLLYKADIQTAGNPKYAYSELSCDSENVVFLPNSGTLGWRRYTYTGSKVKGSEKLNLTIRNSDWREPLAAVHTVKLAAPTAYLSQKQLTLNTNRIGTAYTEIRLKNAYDAVCSCDTVIVEGGSRKAKQLLEEDLLEIRQDGARKDRIVVKINRAETMGKQPVANGTYPYKITPCYTDSYGNAVKMKPLTLKVKVTGKAITARVKTSGKLDLTKEAGNNSSNYISLKATFQNIGSDYTLKDFGNIRLLGEYTDYFELRLLNGRPGEYRLRIKQNSTLKAGQRYKLAIRFMIEMEEGDTFTVQSQYFTVTPKQSVPKIKVYDNNQILYAAADAASRTYELEVPAEGGYQIVSALGSLDCNKDGKPDIKVVQRQENRARVRITVSIADRDGVLASAGKGKTYTIPVTVQLKGRDGIAKDVKTSIKVTVKR